MCQMCYLVLEILCLVGERGGGVAPGCRGKDVTQFCLQHIKDGGRHYRPILNVYILSVDINTIMCLDVSKILTIYTQAEKSTNYFMCIVLFSFASRMTETSSPLAGNSSLHLLPPIVPEYGEQEVTWKSLENDLLYSHIGSIKALHCWWGKISSMSGPM